VDRSDDDGPDVGGGDDRARIGICCSGGGIRSAAFNLGALQSLDGAGVLRRARYLSAVSGGAYIASAYAVASRHSDPELLAERPAFTPGTPEESWVRNHCSYLTNSFTETVRLMAIVLVGLLANLLFFTALLWTVARPLGWFYAWWQPGLRVPEACSPGLSGAAAVDVGCYRTAQLAGLRGWAVIAGLLAGAGLTLTLFVRMFQPGWPLRQALRRIAGILFAAGVVVALVTLVLPELIVLTRNVLGDRPGTGPIGNDVGEASSSDKGAANLGAIAVVGGTATVVALMVQLARPLHAAARTGARTLVGATRWTQRLSQGLRRVANMLLGAVVGPLILAAAALFILNGGATAAPPSGRELAVWGGVTVFTLVMLWFADVTSWSLHPLYKWRLAQTFAVVRSRRPGAEGGTAGLLPYEVPMKLSDFAPDRFPGSTPGRPAFPELLVCAAVNVSDQGTTPPGRSSLPFVFSPSTVGHPDKVVVARPSPWWRRLLYPARSVGDTLPYGPLQMDTATYEARMNPRRSRDVTLSAAVAVSGAAIAPSMGKMTRAPYRFLLALANVRLGVWLPNPANMPAGCTRDDEGVVPPPNPRQVRLLYEVAGRHRVRSKFLYVTDGGHIENLGLLELLRRRCTTIVCLDAAGGSTSRFSTLGEAIALAASELNVTVDIDPAVMGPGKDGVNACDHVTGTIRYPDGTRGTLVYGKALVTAGSPWDVRAYGAKDGMFPVHPTTDQLFSGETFDAYQALGRCVGAACAADVTADDGSDAGSSGSGRSDGTPPAGPPPARTHVRVGRDTSRPPGVGADIHDVAAAAAELP